MVACGADCLMESARGSGGHEGRARWRGRSRSLRCGRWERAESRYDAERYSDQAAFGVCVCMDHSMGMIALQTDFSIDYITRSSL